MLEGNRAVQTSEDPRISGFYTIVYLGDRAHGRPRQVESSRFTSLVRIENDEGAWQGPLTDVWPPDGMWIQYGWLKGEGAYEGWSFFTSFRGSADDARHVGEGVTGRAIHRLRRTWHCWKPHWTADPTTTGAFCPTVRAPSCVGAVTKPTRSGQPGHRGAALPAPERPHRRTRVPWPPTPSPDSGVQGVPHVGAAGLLLIAILARVSTASTTPGM